MDYQQQRNYLLDLQLWMYSVASQSLSAAMDRLRFALTAMRSHLDFRLQNTPDREVQSVAKKVFSGICPQDLGYQMLSLELLVNIGVD
jgi:hypothetical protein